MEITIKNGNGIKFAEISGEGFAVTSVEDGLDLVGECMSNGVDVIIIPERNISAAFFELRTGIAGEIFQKFTLYNIRLAITGDFTNIASRSLNDFIRESNKGKRILFVPSAERALEIFAGG